jgi:hypothetical protein
MARAGNLPHSSQSPSSGFVQSKGKGKHVETFSLDLTGLEIEIYAMGSKDLTHSRH